MSTFTEHDWENLVTKINDAVRGSDVDFDSRCEIINILLKPFDLFLTPEVELEGSVENKDAFGCACAMSEARKCLVI